MVCCSANPRYRNGTFAAASFEFTSLHRAATRRSNVRSFVCDLGSSPNVTSSINRTSHNLAVEAQYSSPRAPRRTRPYARTYEVSRSEHDLNSAILYAVQSGYQRRCCLPDLRCRPLGELCSGLFRAARRPHSRAIPWPQASRFQPIFQVLFYCSGAFA
jgi:hypothetical protein